jgi:hypothetical protein
MLESRLTFQFLLRGKRAQQSLHPASSSTTHIYHNRQRHTWLYGGGGGRVSGSMLLLLSYDASVLVDPNLEFDSGVVVECISLGGFRICSKSNGCEVT